MAGLPMPSTVIPAYGRDYKNEVEIRADLDANKDFQIADIDNPYDGSYINKEQIPAGTTINFRYAKLRKVARITV